MHEIDYGIKWYGVPKDKVDTHFQSNHMPDFDPLTGEQAEKAIAATRARMISNVTERMKETTK